MKSHDALRALLRRAANAALAITVMGCASAGSGASIGTGASFGRRDEVRVIGSFADVRAVGVSRRYVYAATPSGISVYDRLFNSWLPPLSRATGLVDMQITFMTGDPLEDAVWLGVPGGIIMFRPQGEVLQRTMITGVPDFIVFDRATSGDAYVRAGGQWTRVSRVGIATPVAGPPAPDMRITPRTLNDVYAAYPGLRNGAPLLFRNQQVDRPLRSYPVLSGSSSPDQPAEVWLGTNGDGLYRVDATQQLATPLRFGLLERGVGAVALAADGVWAAGLGASSQRGGLTFASNDLQQWRWIDGTINVPLNSMRATRLAVRGPRAWIATDRGLVRARLDAGEEMVVWTTLDGLPDDRISAIAPRNDGAWVGTAQGVVYVSDSADARNARTRGISAHVLNGTPVYALQAIGDTLWMGTESGLVAMLPGGTLSRPVGADPALRRRVVALAWSDSVLLAATDDAVLQLAPKGGREPTRIMALDAAQVGQVTRLAMDDRTIVMTGTTGVMVVQRNGGVRALRVPNDIPGPVLDVAMSRDWIWLATPEGLVRLRRAGDGGLP